MINESFVSADVETEKLIHKHTAVKNIAILFYKTCISPPFVLLRAFTSLYYINLFKEAIYYALFIIFINFGSFG